LRAALPLRLALPALEPFLAENVAKEVRKDALVIRRAGEALAPGAAREILAAARASVRAARVIASCSRSATRSRTGSRMAGSRTEWLSACVSSAYNRIMSNNRCSNSAAVNVSRSRRPCRHASRMRWAVSRPSSTRRRRSGSILS